MRRTDFDVEVGERLRRLRLKRRLMQREVGEWIGVRQGVVSQIELGARRLSFSEAVLVAHYLDIDMRELVP